MLRVTFTSATGVFPLPGDFRVYRLNRRKNTAWHFGQRGTSITRLIALAPQYGQNASFGSG